MLKQTPDPLPSGLGQTRLFSMASFSERHSAMEHKRTFIKKHYPDPLPSEIGIEDLPGGFRRENTLSGMSRPLYDLARGIVQVDGIKVLFDARA